MSRIVVVDTNVFISALRSPDGTNRAVLRACLDGRLEPLMGTTLLCEFEDVMGRHELFETVPVSEQERLALLAAFMSRATWKRVSYRWRPNLTDEADNHVLELAIAGGAEAIVTNNVRDFIRGELAFPGLRILTPKQLLEEL